MSSRTIEIDLILVVKNLEKFDKSGIIQIFSVQNTMKSEIINTSQKPKGPYIWKYQNYIKQLLDENRNSNLKHFKDIIVMKILHISDQMFLVTLLII